MDKMNVGFWVINSQVVLRHCISWFPRVILPHGFVQRSKAVQPTRKPGIAQMPPLYPALGRAGAEAGHEATGDTWRTVSTSAELVIGLVIANSGLVNLVPLGTVALSKWHFSLNRSAVNISDKTRRCLC